MSKIFFLITLFSFVWANDKELCERTGGVWVWHSDFRGPQCEKKLIENIEEYQDSKSLTQQTFEDERALQRYKLLRENNYEKAYKEKLIDKDTARDGMLKSGLILEAYQAKLIDKKTYLVKANSLGKIDKKTYFLEAYKEKLIDKDTARSGLLDAGYVLEAYQAKLIDKDTASLYLQKQANDKAAEAAREQAYMSDKRAKEQADLAKRQADAAESQARAARDQADAANNQANQMFLNNFNNNMRKYY